MHTLNIINRKILLFVFVLILASANIAKWIGDQGSQEANDKKNHGLVEVKSLVDVAYASSNVYPFKRDIFELVHKKKKVVPLQATKNPKKELTLSPEELEKQRVKNELDKMVLSGVIKKNGRFNALIVCDEDFFTVSNNDRLKDGFIVSNIQEDRVTVQEHKYGFTRTITIN